LERAVMRPVRHRDVPVTGGPLRVARWDGPGPLVLAVHGITATHVAWVEVAEQAPDLTLVAPDLRGRGRSADLPGPYGFAAHVADLVALLDDVGCERAVVAGHSMGGFVAVALAATHPDRIARLVLVEGGLPLGRPEDPVPEGALDTLLGPAAARLAMTFPTRDAYRDLWRAHPALGPIWGPAVAAYADYDLIGEPPGLRSSCREEAMRTDGADVHDHRSTAQALRAVRAPVTFLRAERGLLDEPVPLYPDAAMARLAAEWPGLDVRDVPGTNHYSILLGTEGAREVARALAEATAG
jgi:lipase